MAGIFISYRRDDSAGYAGRIFDRLSDHFGPDQVFMDVDTIKPGQDFVAAVRQAVGGCDGLIAIIGREWLTISDAAGVRRLDDPQDIVSLEIATALERGIRVIPVLVQGAPMPAATDFPESLKELAYRNAQEISDRSFNSDAQSLIEALEAPGPEPAEGTAFFGREREFLEFRTALEGALAGHGRLAMLAGEPGIGKTRMAQELASHAERQGAQVLWGWCYEQAGAPPYWPWVDSVRSYINLTDADQLRSLMGSGAADICEVIPELREKLPDLEPPPALDPDQARFRLFDSFANFFINAAQVQPLMLVLDDLQWADKPSLLLLEFLTKRLAESRMLVLGTYRDAEVTQETPLFESLAQFRRSPMFLSRVLEGLESGQVGGFIQEAGGEPSQELIDAIYAHTEGNPFFISEVIRLLVERGELEEISSNIGPVSLDIPQGILEVVGQRLNRLSADCNDVLTNISFAGRQFDFKLLELLNEQTQSIQLLEMVDEALEARVIEEVPGHSARYQFIHALMQQTLLEGLSTSRKVRVHARIGEALETLYAERLEEHASELAYHFYEGAMVSGTDKLVKYAGMAGEGALESYAWEEALAHFESGLVARGVSLSSDAEPAADDEVAALLFGLARSRGAIGVGAQLEQAFSAFSRAFEYYERTGNLAMAVAVAEFPLAPPTGRIRGVKDLLARAISLVPADSHEAGRLLSRYGGILGLANADYEGAQKALGRATVIARRENDMRLEIQTLAYSADVSGNHLRWQESAENGLRAINLATGDENTYSEVLPRWWTMVSMLHLGNLEGARIHAPVLREVIDRRSTSQFLSWLSAVPLAALSCVEGDWESGREYTDRGLAVSSTLQLIGIRTLLEYETGKFAEGEDYLERLVEAEPLNLNQHFTSGRTSMTIARVARITGHENYFDVAESIAESVLLAQSVTPMLTMYAKVALAMLAVQRGDEAAVEEYYSYLLDKRGTMLWTITTVDRLLGQLSQTMRSYDQAVEHFEEALAFCRNARYQPELAWTCCDYSDTLLQRNGEGDHIKAESLLSDSLAISTELGMLPLMERVLSRREILKA